jgi:signal transduction histidine kinase
MKELFKQLLLNSMQHAKPAVAPKVLIAFREFQNNSQHGKGSRKFCEITLSDNGIGFLPEFSEKIFRMFQKLNPSDNKAGAGLAICKKIVDKHKGSIEAHGVLGKGAIFTINLPLEN